MLVWYCGVMVSGFGWVMIVFGVLVLFVVFGLFW